VAVDELVQFDQLGETIGSGGVHAGDEFELRFAEIGRDVRMRQCRTEFRRMRGQRQETVAARAQALLLDAAAQPAQPLRRERLQARLQQPLRLTGRRAFGDDSGVGRRRSTRGRFSRRG